MRKIFIALLALLASISIFALELDVETAVNMAAENNYKVKNNTDTELRDSASRRSRHAN